METNNDLRRKVKLLKAIGQVDSFCQIAEMIDIKNKSFYNWLRGEYNFGNKTLRKLKTLIDDLWIPIEEE